MNSNEKLDAVLGYLKEAHDDRIVTTEGVDENGRNWLSIDRKEFEKHWKDNLQIGIQALKEEVDLKEVEAIMEYLENEKLVISKLSASSGGDYKRYTATFTGKLFMENGGFVAKHNREFIERKRIEQLETTQIKQSKNMTMLTVALVVVSLPAFIYNFFQLLQSDASIFTLEATTVLTLCILSVLGGLMVGLVLKEIKK